MYRYNNRSRLLGGRAGQCARGQAVLTRSLSYAMSINVLRPRLLRRTSSVALDYQPFLGYYNCRLFFFFSGSIPINRFFCFPLTRFVASARTTKEGTNQAPIVTRVSTYRKHSRASCNRACTDWQSTYIPRNVRVDRSATTQASRQEQVKCCREPQCYVRKYVTFPVSLFVEYVYTST